jgi:hypothetical protein
MNQMSSNVGPMSRRNGIPTGEDMERGMLRQGELHGGIGGSDTGDKPVELAMSTVTYSLPGRNCEAPSFRPGGG